ncbi:MAG: hypothetical protein HUJ25_14415 [Crocinitomicaceae bacterium]|nr:hypothetical protein [Crocinitomicaceae bacterium]
MRKVLYAAIIGVVAILASCKGSAEGETNDTDTTAIVDTTDTTTANVDSSLFMDDSGYVDESLETENIIEATYGKQWDFCDCVVKNDSVEQAFLATEDEDEQNRIMDRWDEIDKHCKTILTTPNTTPEEREKHERRVRKCLRDAK